MTGIDNVSSTTIVSAGGTTTITDLAGHTTTLYFSRYRVRSADIDIRMDTIKYGSGTTTALTGVRLNYAWTTSGGAINFLDEDVRSGNARLRGTYHNPPNTTYLENEPETGGDTVFTLSGLVPVRIRSNAGSVGTYY